MKDLFALKKLSPALALSLQSIRIMLSVTEVRVCPSYLVLFAAYDVRRRSRI